MIAIYARVSTNVQATKGYSIEDQLRQCRKKAGKADVKEYVDKGLSGAYLERPALSQMRQDLKDGLIEKVIVYDLDRLSRTLPHQLLLADEIEKRAELIFVNGEYAKTPEGIMFFQMRGVIAQFEKAKIAERMKNGRKSKALKGKVVKDCHVYGYKYNKEEGELEVNEEEAKIVQLIFAMFVNPPNHIQGINGIANYLTNSGVPTKRGAKVWHRQVVRQILMNETYSGTFYHNKWDTTGMLANKYKTDEEEKVKMTTKPREEWVGVEVPALVDEQTFKQAQRLLKESRRRWAKKPKNKYLLSGLLRCSHCGNTMTGRKAKNWGTYVFQYTCRKNTAGAKCKGCGNDIKCEVLDVNVWALFLELVNREIHNQERQAALSEVAVAIEEVIPFEQREIERIDNELEKIKKARKKLLNLYTMDEDFLEEDDFRQQMKEFKDKEIQLNEVRKELVETLAEQQDDFDEENLQRVIERFLELDHEHISFEEKQSLLRQTFREIRVIDENNLDPYLW